jgi:hypothetical protein
MTNKRRRGPGRPRLGADARDVVLTVRLTKRQYKVIAAHVRRMNAEIATNSTDRPFMTVSGWVRDVIADAIPTPLTNEGKLHA